MRTVKSLGEENSALKRAAARAEVDGSGVASSGSVRRTQFAPTLTSAAPAAGPKDVASLGSPGQISLRSNDNAAPVMRAVTVVARSGANRRTSEAQSIQV